VVPLLTYVLPAGAEEVTERVHNRMRDTRTGSPAWWRSLAVLVLCWSCHVRQLCWKLNALLQSTATTVCVVQPIGND
jgi:hypothetical protein